MSLEQLIKTHFMQAEHRVDAVYQQHFSSSGAIIKRHWRHKQDIPADLAALPRSVLLSVLRAGRILFRQPATKTATPHYETGKQREIRRIIFQQLLDLPGLEHKIEQHTQKIVQNYQHQIDQHPTLTEPQIKQFEDYIGYQLDRLQLTHEGLREGLLAFTLMISGKILGDKAILSSAASIGGTLATSAYLSQQGWLAALWASWMGVPGWVSVAGAGVGVLAALLVSPLLAPGFEWGFNKLRARKLLLQTVHDAEQQILKKDGLLYASRLGLYLQLLPDLAQFIQRLK